MKKALLNLIILAFLSFSTFGQTKISGNELLDKAIMYHDPLSKWPTFNNSLYITTHLKNSSIRHSMVSINKPEDSFYLKSTRDTLVTEYTVLNNQCNIIVNGNKVMDSVALKKLNINCERGFMLRDYYTYLYGLPMKLKDTGTIVHDAVEEKTLKDKTYLVLKVTYDETVGKDTWYFYFNPESYALELYQFYHDEEKNDGEYILLSGETLLNGIKIPKKRDWYYNSNDNFLGSDVLTN